MSTNNGGGGEPGLDWHAMMSAYYASPVDPKDDEPIVQDPTDINGFGFSSDSFYDNMLRSDGMDELVKFNSQLTNGIEKWMMRSLLFWFNVSESECGEDVWIFWGGILKDNLCMEKKKKKMRNHICICTFI